MTCSWLCSCKLGWCFRVSLFLLSRMNKNLSTKAAGLQTAFYCRLNWAPSNLMVEWCLQWFCILSHYQNSFITSSETGSGSGPKKRGTNSTVTLNNHRLQKTEPVHTKADIRVCFYRCLEMKSLLYLRVSVSSALGLTRFSCI